MQTNEITPETDAPDKAPESPQEASTVEATLKPARKPSSRKRVAERATKAEPEQAGSATPEPGDDGVADAPEEPTVEAPRKRTRLPGVKGKSGTKAPAKPRKGGGPTLLEIAGIYIGSLESEGCSTATVTGYRAELRRAMKALGEETLVADLTAEAVAKFNRSRAVTKKRDGSARDEKTVARTRRVLRLCLLHAADAGLIAEAPIPERD